MNSKFFSFLFACTFMMIVGCAKDEYGYGSVKFVNRSTNPYELSVDGISKGEISGGDSKTIELDAGYHKLKAEQVRGYILYPTIKNGEITVIRGDLLEWSFP